MQILVHLELPLELWWSDSPLPLGNGKASVWNNLWSQRSRRYRNSLRPFSEISLFSEFWVFAQLRGLMRAVSSVVFGADSIYLRAASIVGQTLSALADSLLNVAVCSPNPRFLPNSI